LREHWCDPNHPFPSPGIRARRESWRQPWVKRNNEDLQAMKTYMCVVCGFVYEEEKGWPKDGIAPGTRWEDVPENWKCPECGAAKHDFEMIEI
jgi:rubredoxin